MTTTRVGEPRERGGRRWHLLGTVLSLALVASGACSLLIESETDQCKTDNDCTSFGEYSVCSKGICVAPAPITDAGSDAPDGDPGDGGCFTGVPAVDLEYYNQCTDAGCDPFDNCARLGLCGDAGLPPLVSPDGGS